MWFLRAQPRQGEMAGSMRQNCMVTGVRFFCKSVAGTVYVRVMPKSLTDSSKDHMNIQETGWY